jgi:hypothetical protein
VTELFANRMREATIILRDEDQATYEKAVSEAAGANLDGSTLLDIVRLTFELALRESDREGMKELFLKRGIQLSPRSLQLEATLATLTLIERFSRPIGKRRRLAQDSLAAIAVVVLTAQGRSPVHPDLPSYAAHWVASASEHMRAAGSLKLSSPPELPESLATTAASSEGEEAAAPRDVNADVNDLREYVATLDQWLRRASVPGRVNALEEQQGLIWWLEGAPDTNENDARSVVSVCDELAALSRYFPGPPGAPGLLAHRLGEKAERTIALGDLARVASRSVPASVTDLCALLSGTAAHRTERASAVEAATWLYDELQLVKLATPDDGE